MSSFTAFIVKNIYKLQNIFSLIAPVFSPVYTLAQAFFHKFAGT